MKTLLLICLLGIFLSSCKEDPISPSGRLYEIPSTVGSYWKYTVYDSISHLKDTVEVRIISSIAFTDGKVTQWKFNNIITSDTIAVIFSGDTIRTVLCSFAQKYQLMLFSPLSVGLEYNTKYGYIEVQACENVTSEVNNFENCFRVSNSLQSPSEINKIIYWIKPGIGIVRVQRSYFATTGLHKQEVYWKLIDYNIVK